jgi:hypothetical protein
MYQNKGIEWYNHLPFEIDIGYDYYENHDAKLEIVDDAIGNIHP